MARNQGLNRLLTGVDRDLHKSEIDRCYIFISKDRALLDKCHYNLNVRFNNEELGIRKIDKYGRIFPKSEFRRKLKNSKKVNLALKEDFKNIEITVR